MTDLQKLIEEQIWKLVPGCEKLEFWGNVSDSSFAMEFFATVDGKRMQCYQMADEGLLKEKELDAAFKTIADHFRTDQQYICGESNQISFEIQK